MKNIVVTAVLAATLLPLSTHASEYYYNEGSNQVFYAAPLDNPKFQTILQEPLKESEPDQRINKGDAYSITLLSAFICDFHEAGIFDWVSGLSNGKTTKCSGGDGYQGKNTRGEIAIVVNADEAKSGGGFSFSNSSAQSGRLVYYDQDVREAGQLINALNLPVREASIYNGRPFFFDLTILELDNKENSSSRALLSTLAAIGKTASPANSAAFNLLNELGSTLINQNKDDVELRFQMRFDPPRNKEPEKEPKTGRMPLREGYYLVMRQENRSQDSNTDALQIDSERGVVVCCPTKTNNCPSKDSSKPTCKPNSIYRGTTWLLFRISKEDTETAKQMEQIKLLNETLENTINNAETIEATGVIKAIKELVDAKTNAFKAETELLKLQKKEAEKPQ